MSEDILIKVTADTGQADASLKKTQAATKAIGDEATATGAKSKSAFDGMSRNIVPAAAAYMAVRLAMRGVREVMQELDAASKDNSLVSGKLKEAALVASDSVKNLETAFDKFKQTAVSAIAPVIGYIAEDLSNALKGATKDMDESNDAIQNFANAWAITKTIVSVLADTFNILFQGLRGYLSMTMESVSMLIKGFGYLASVVSKDVGNSIQDFGETLSNSAKQIMEEANDSFMKSGKSLGKALSGAMYEETMAGFDKYKAAIKDKAKELKTIRDAELEKKTKTTETDESYRAIASKQITEELKSYQIKEEKKRLLLEDSTAQIEAILIESAKRDDQRVEDEKKRIEDIAKAKEEAAKIAKAAYEEETASLAEQAEVDAKRQKIADLRGTGGGNVTTDAQRELRPDVSDYEEPIFGPDANKPMADQTPYEEQLKQEQERLMAQVDFRQEHADRLLQIETELNGGVIRIQNEATMKEARLNKQRVLSAQEVRDGISGALGNLAVLMQTKNKTLFEIGRAAALAQNVVDTWSSAASSFAFGARIGGPVLGGVFAATAVAAGAVRASQLLSASPSSGGNIGSGGYNDTSNVGGPGGNTSGAGVGASSQVNVSLYGERFGADQVRGLIDAINAETKDGKKVTVKV